MDQGRFDMFNSKLVTCKDTRTTIPLRLYGDGADAAQKFEIMTMLPICATSVSTMDTRLLLSVRNSEKTTTAARAEILEVIAWSFESLRALFLQVDFF